jgi:hypothetical protein
VFESLFAVGVNGVDGAGGILAKSSANVDWKESRVVSRALNRLSTCSICVANDDTISVIERLLPTVVQVSCICPVTLDKLAAEVRVPTKSCYS